MTVLDSELSSRSLAAETTERFFEVLRDRQRHVFSPRPGDQRNADWKTFRRRHAGARLRRAVFATARELAIHVYRMLRFGRDYVDDGAQACEQRLHQSASPPSALSLDKWDASLSLLRRQPKFQVRTRCPSVATANGEPGVNHQLYLRS